MRPISAKVKICGIKDAENLKAALDADADYIGFVFVKGSPRFITPEDAWQLANQFSASIRPEGRKLVAVLANPTDQELADVLSAFSPDIIQLHGSETPERVREIASVYDIVMMKAVPVASRDDIEYAKEFIGYADMLLFDAKAEAPQTENMLTGGHGKSFDWTLMRSMHINIPWFLSGGLNAENVQEALRTAHATMVDVSSGVESSRGQKDPERIRAFIAAAKPTLEETKDHD
ncbi:MAG: phosphoribosylanthranilate isomerase [Alphaproteobacteria bacterium]|nr:phosphoribosylanthranilate isomerase [Alphaproteobacteria bacterium]